MGATNEMEIITTPLAALPPIDRAYLVLSEKHNEKSLLDLSRKYIDVTEIKDVTDYRLVMRGGIELMKARTAIEATGKAARDDANQFRKAVIAEERRLILITLSEESRLKALRKDYDDEQDRIAEEARLLEVRRIADITERIQAIKKMTDGLLNSDSTAIQMRLDAVATITCSEPLFAEFAEQAADVKQATVTTLKQALAERVAFEVQQADQARIAEEQADRQVELGRQAEEQRRQDAERQAEIDRRLGEIEKAEARIDAELKAEEDRKLEAERAEAEKVKREHFRLEQEKHNREAAKKKAAEKEAEAARQEALRPEKEKLLEWLKRLFEVDQIDLESLTLKTIQSDVIEQIGDITKIAAKRVEAL